MASAESPPSDEGGSWIGALKVLAPVAGTLATVATNPEQWLRAHVLGIIAEWVVTNVFFRPAQWALGFVLDVFGMMASALGSAGDGVVSGVASLGVGLVSVPTAIQSGLSGSLEGLGLGAPLAAAISLIISLAFVVTVLGLLYYGLRSAIPGAGALEVFERWM